MVGRGAGTVLLTLGAGAGLTLIIGLVGADSGPNSLAEKTEVEFDADYALKYVNVVKAITAVSGQVKDGQIVELIKKIKFTPPKRG